MIKRLVRYLTLLVIVLALHYAPAMAQGVPLAPGERAPIVHDYPNLQGATMGTIGPQDSDVTVVSGVMTAGTVRVNNLANLEAALNILANSMELIWIGYGLYLLGKTLLRKVKTATTVMMGLANSAAFATIGFMSPHVINWGVICARDAALFN